MAVIQHIDPDVHSLSHNGIEYETGGDGLFDVPHAVAAELVRFPQFRMYDGLPWPREKTKEELEAERIAGMVRSAVEAMQASTPAPAKKDRLAAARAALASKKSGKKGK
jgi:hypothetical protein